MSVSWSLSYSKKVKIISFCAVSALCSSNSMMFFIRSAKLSFQFFIHGRTFFSNQFSRQNAID